MALDSGFEQRTLSLEDVVGLAEIEQTVLEGLELDLSLGYQYTNASDITQLIFGSDMRGRREQRYWQANIDANSSSSSDTEASQRIKADNNSPSCGRSDGTGAVCFRSRPTTSWVSSCARRSAAAAGEFFRQSNRNLFRLLGGLVLTKEDVQSPDEETEDEKIEGVLAGDFEWFRFDEPELDVTTRISLFPDLSDTGQFRTNLDVDFKWEVFSDLFLSFSIYHTHNSDPPNDGTQNDYGFSTNVGWEF